MRSGGFSNEANTTSAFSPFRFLKRVAVLLFALIQGVLIARILLDLGVIPPDNAFGTFVIFWSDTLAAPVQGLGNSFGWLGGGAPLPGALPPGLPGMPGGDMFSMTETGLNAVMLAALAGWTIVEWLVMRFVNKLQQV